MWTLTAALFGWTGAQGIRLRATSIVVESRMCRSRSSRRRAVDLVRPNRSPTRALSRSRSDLNARRACVRPGPSCEKLISGQADELPQRRGALQVPMQLSHRFPASGLAQDGAYPFTGWSLRGMALVCLVGPPDMPA